MPGGGEPFGTAGTRRGLSVCMLIGAAGPSVRGLGVRGEERMQKMRVSLEDEARCLHARCIHAGLKVLVSSVIGIRQKS